MSINPLKAQSTMLLCNQIDLLAQQSRVMIFFGVIKLTIININTNKSSTNTEY